MCESRGYYFLLVRFVGEPLLPKLFSAIFAEVDLAGTEFESGSTLLDHMLTLAGWTTNRCIHLL